MNKQRPTPIKHEVILSPEDISPSSENMQVIGVCNPGVTTIGKGNSLATLLMTRVTEKPKDKCENEVPLPYYSNLSPDNRYPEIKFDMIPKKNIIEDGKKEVRFKVEDERGKSFETIRLKHTSHPETMIRYTNGEITKRPDLNLFPAWEPDEFGIEDVRITKIQDPNIISELGGKYILTYVVPHRRHGVGTIISITDDFKNFTRLPFGTTPRVTPGKDIIIFPEKCLSTHNPLRGPREMQFVGFRRPSEHGGIKTPGMVVDYSRDLVSWGPPHEIAWEITKGNTTGIGTPPIKLGDSWFVAFHEAVPYTEQDAKRWGHTHFYHTRLMTLDLRNPWRVKTISDILLKREDFRKILPEPGFVPNVVYTTGLTIINGIATFYSGVDDRTVVASSYYKEDLEKFLGEK